MVSAKKKKLVENLKKDIESYPIIGLVNMQNLPAQQLQKMRAMLKEKGVKIIMTRKKLIKLALNDSMSIKKNIVKLTEKAKGMPALLFTNNNPFSLYSLIQKNKSEAPAKAGQESPKDIVVKSGPTNFAPGPIISELAAVGIKTKVDGGKLAIIDDVVVAKEGDTITAKLAETLKRLDIKPMEIGLNLVAVWENGLIFNAKQLHIDEKEYSNNFTQASQWAMNLAIESAYTTKETIEILLQKVVKESKALAIEQNFITEETRDEILAKAESQAISVKESGKIKTGTIPVKKNDATENKEKKKENKPVEEVKNQDEEIKSLKEEIKETKKENSPVIKKEELKNSAEKLAKEQTKEQKAEVKSEEKNKQTTSEQPKQSHPKQGTITPEEAENLLLKLQKEGSLRN